MSFDRTTIKLATLLHSVCFALRTSLALWSDLVSEHSEQEKSTEKLTYDHPDARNNTTQANLTYYERSLLRKDNSSKRVGGDSFKPLDACNLCLSRASDPVACPQGHLYCRECVITDLITQKAGIESQKREMERWEVTELREREEARLKARERVVKDFERGMGLGGAGGKQTLLEKGDGKAGERFKFDQEAVERVALEAEQKAMKRIEAEQAEARKAKLPAYWLPSLTPETKLGPLKDIKLQTMCHLGEHPHPLSSVASRFEYCPS